MSIALIAGQLPVSWGGLGAFPELEQLYLDSNFLNGEAYIDLSQPVVQCHWHVRLKIVCLQP